MALIPFIFLENYGGVILKKERQTLHLKFFLILIRNGQMIIL